MKVNMLNVASDPTLLPDQKIRGIYDEIVNFKTKRSPGLMGGFQAIGDMFASPSQVPGQFAESVIRDAISYGDQTRQSALDTVTNRSIANQVALYRSMDPYNEDETKDREMLRRGIIHDINAQRGGAVGLSPSEAVLDSSVSSAVAEPVSQESTPAGQLQAIYDSIVGGVKKMATSSGDAPSGQLGYPSQPSPVSGQKKQEPTPSEKKDRKYSNRVHGEARILDIMDSLGKKDFSLQAEMKKHPRDYAELFEEINGGTNDLTDEEIYNFIMSLNIGTAKREN